MKNITKKEITLIILTIAVIALEAFSIYGLFAKGTAMNWSLFTIAFSSLTVSFCALEKNKKSSKENN